jgi:hypothetical protein
MLLTDKHSSLLAGAEENRFLGPVRHDDDRGRSRRPLQRSPRGPPPWPLPGVNVIKLFSSSLTLWPNKPECL